MSENTPEKAESNPIGRPTLYKPEYCVEIIEYFSVEPYSEVERDVVTKSGDVAKIFVNEAADFPSFAGFAARIGVHRETILNWTKEYPEFFDAYKRAKELQDNYVIVNGNKGLINTVFGIFTAKCVLGWRDGSAPLVVNNNSNNQGIPRTVDEIDAEIRELSAANGLTIVEAK